MLSDNIAGISRRIIDAATRAGRKPADVRLVAVTKTVDVILIQKAIDAGLRVFGENRVQEAREKIDYLGGRPGVATGVQWHLIGPLQRNKAKYAVGLFDLIHSVDSAALADELERHALKTGKLQKILVEVKLSEEETKHGVAEDGLELLLEHISGLNGLALQGLMTIPPFFGDPEEARPYFRRLRELRDDLQKKGFHLPELSMGMSNDFEVAIAEGATFVRIGTAIFGERG
jgi:pyridoxal phosphate enzyme (YggS family)